MNRNFGLFFSLAGLMLISCHKEAPDAKSAKQKSANIKVEGMIAQYAVLDQTITVSGTLKPFEETVLMPEVSGRVVAINLPEGTLIKQGTLLVKLFDGDLQAQLHKSQAQLKLAEQTENRQAELMKVNGISQNDYDQTVLQINSLKADIELVNVQIRKTEVRAPFDGTIGLKNISVGAMVNPTTALVSLRDVRQLKLDFSVPEKYSSSIKSGMKVRFALQGDDSKYEASVMASEQSIDYNTRTLKARALVKNSKKALVPGAFANVELRLGENKEAILVPTQAVIPQERNKKIILAKGGKAKFVVIKTGTRTSSRIEVLSGVEAGDTVITTGILFLKNNAPVKFSKVKRDSI